MCGNLGLLLLECSPAKARELLEHLDAMVAATSIRGAQGGGLSCLQYRMPGDVPALMQKNPIIGDAEAPANLQNPTVLLPDAHDRAPKIERVRVLRRKRQYLSEMIATEAQRRFTFLKDGPVATTFIGHTRFATGSLNRLEEIHPHEWCPPQTESVWRYTAEQGFHETQATVGIHITHNGDFDGLDAFNCEITNSDLGKLLGIVLGVESPLKGDSPKIAGFMDLARVQGRLAAAARLAVLRISDSLVSVHDIRATWEDWVAFEDEILRPVLQRCLKRDGSKIIRATTPGRYTVPKDAIRELVAAGMERIQDLKDRNAFAPTLGKGRSLCIGTLLWGWDDITTQSFLHHTFRGFLRSDCYTALAEMLSRATGSFGIQVHCTLEPGAVVIAAKGQPMAFGYEPNEDTPILTFGSETAAVRVPVKHEELGYARSADSVRMIFDVDEGGEIVRLGAKAPYDDENVYTDPEREEVDLSDPLERTHCLSLLSGLQIRVYNIAGGAELTAAQISKRALAVPQASRSTAASSGRYSDLVEKDIKEVADVVREIDSTWLPDFVNGSQSRHGSYLKADAPCVRATDALCHELIRLIARRAGQHSEKIDLLIGGCEISQWVAEQFASDMRLIFPYLSISVVSANQLVGIFTEGRKKVVFTGSSSVDAEMLGPETCILLISQSGQTFPTLHATKVLCTRHPDRVWVLTGEKSSKMQQSVVQGLEKAGMDPGLARLRVIANGSGHRPAEPSSLAALCAHHTLTHIIFRCTAMMHKYLLAVKCLERAWGMHQYRRGRRKSMILRNEASSLPRKTCKLAPDCLQDLESMTVPALATNLEDLAGSRERSDTHTDVHEELVRVGKVWGKHVSEPWRVLVVAGAYIFIATFLGMPIVNAIVRLVSLAFDNCDTRFSLELLITGYDEDNHAACIAAGAVANVLDALIYIYIGKILARLLRAKEGRYMWSRLGSRTVVIVDTPLVHRLLEAFLSKLFSQAYSFVSIDVHSGNGVDDFVHWYTHRVVRGVLLAVGRVDGRMSALTKTEQATILSCKQARFIENPDLPGHTGPEVISCGHNPYWDAALEDEHVTLPSHQRRPFLDQFVYNAIIQMPSEARMAEALTLVTTIGEELRKQEAFRSQMQNGHGSRKMQLLRRASSAFDTEGDDTLDRLLAEHSWMVQQVTCAMTLKSEGPKGGKLVPRKRTYSGEEFKEADESKTKGIPVGLHYLHDSLYADKNVGPATASPNLMNTTVRTKRLLLRMGSSRGLSDRQVLSVRSDTSAMTGKNSDAEFYTYRDSDELPAPPSGDWAKRSGSENSISSINSASGRDSASGRASFGSTSGRALRRPSEPVIPTHYTAELRSLRSMEMLLTQPSMEEEEEEEEEEESASTAPGPCTPSARPASGKEENTASEETTDAPNKQAIDNNDYNPSQLIAFYSSMSKEWERVQERQKLVQRLFESRVAGMERFFSFCVLFHVMARMCSRPWLCAPWQIDMSQSNLRVATTAAPVPASDAATGSAEVPVEIRSLVRKSSVRFTGFVNNF